MTESMRKGYFLPSLFLFVLGLVLYLVLLVAAPRFASIPIALSGVSAPSLVAAAVWATLEGRRAIPAGAAHRALGSKTEYAIGCYLLVASVSIVEGLTYLNFALTSFVSTLARLGSPLLEFDIYHVILHYGFSSSLALGFGVAMAVIAVGPVRSGQKHSWLLPLAMGIVPSIGIILITTVQLVSWSVYLVVPSLNFSEIHLYELAIPVFWFAGTVLLYLDSGNATA